MGEEMVWPTLSPALRERVEQIRGRERSQPPHYYLQPRATRQLSDRHREVLAMVTAGDSNTEIAAALQIATCTVQSHVQRILELLPARNRTHAVTVAFRQGLLTLDD
jgi:DNA-binding NarL/FixJ family response regulator